MPKRKASAGPSGPPPAAAQAASKAARPSPAHHHHHSPAAAQAASVGRAEAAFRNREYAAAARAAGDVLGDTAALARAAVVRGKALLATLLAQVSDAQCDDPPPNAFREPMRMFQLATKLAPGNAEAKAEMRKIEGVFAVLPDDDQPEPNHGFPLDVVIVGAGAAGVGVALMLLKTFHLDPDRVLLVERGDAPGETFRRWPREMRFISPSFNNQGWTDSFDLNSVAYGTSPAYTLGVEHPTGKDYAFYLNALAEVGGLNVQTRTEVTAVRPRRNNKGFWVDVAPRPGTAEEGAPPLAPLRTRYVIWAAGEFQYPYRKAPAAAAAAPALFSGAELCMHNSSVRSWKELPGDDFVVIGGYESGMDAAFNLASCGKRCTVVSSTACWSVTTDDPSTELSPYTAQRVRDALATSTPPRLLAPLRVEQVERVKAADGGGYCVHARWGAPVSHPGGHLRVPLQEGQEEEAGAGAGAAAAAAAAVGGNDDRPGEEGTEMTLRTPHPPMLCTGFEGSVSLGVAKELFAFGGADGCTAGAPILTLTDESTLTPGLFLVGSLVRHGELSFCFVYKFRQRFGIVADTIARGLGRDTRDAVAECRKIDMYLDDFESCKGACGESC